MIFAGAPIATLVAVFASAAAAIALLHLVRPRRRRVVVAYLPIVQRALASAVRGVGGMRFRRFLSLALTLLALACIVGAAGDPRPSLEPPRTLVLLLDAGASMQVRDERGPGGGAITRSQRARERALSLIADLNPSDRALVLRVDEHPRPLGGFSSDRAELERVVSSIEPGTAAPDLAAGLRLALALLHGQPRPTIVVLSDGAAAQEVLDRSSASLDPSVVDLRYVSVGTSGDDVAITAFAARRSPADPSSVPVLVELQSDRANAGDVELQLLVDDQVVHVERVALSSRQRAQRILEDLPLAGGRVEARIRSTGGAPVDAFPVDDRATLSLPTRHRPRVLLVTEHNLFLEGALLACDRADVDKIAPAAWAPQAERTYDLVIFDGFTPPAPPSTPALYLDPQGAASPFAIRGTLRDPLVTTTARHPLTRFVSLTDVNIAVASRLALETGDVALASVVGDVVFAARDGRPRVAALGFDVKRSDLPMRVAFPVLLANAIEWLPGDSFTRAPSMAALLDAEARRLEPRPTLTAGGRPLAAPGRPRRVESAPWRALLLLAIGLLCLEWWAYHRRVTA